MEKNEPMIDGRLPVMFIPGGISPAVATYGPLLEVLKDRVRPVLKDLEVYAADTPSPGYGLEVQPLSVVDKSDFSPTCLTDTLDGPYACFTEGNGPSSSF